MWGMTIREQLGESLGPAFLDRLVSGDALPAAAQSPDLRGYFEAHALNTAGVVEDKAIYDAAPASIARPPSPTKRCRRTRS